MPPRLTKRAPAAKAKAGKSAKAIAKLLTDPKSVLATADLYRLLTNPKARDVLTSEEWAEITALFPVASPPPADTELSVATLANDPGFRHTCATYSENLAEGRHDAGWLECAWTAQARRKAGAFDAHLAAKFEDEWGVAAPQAQSEE
ncbi:hypothetical protein PLICBS_009660 [Purpureocillium lilacinum]|uniref:uncharacterized protein n=1 Tax=Purpureocillium lilacinum TaxID=33203 RepID=UPI002081E39C|nr:hypothetical protein PLICBS_009660 [Purpureocillium lilacinum]